MRGLKVETGQQETHAPQQNRTNFDRATRTSRLDKGYTCARAAPQRAGDRTRQQACPYRLGEDKTRGRIGLPGACEYWWPEWPGRGLVGNEIARALISMVARSTTRSNVRPDTLMQDPHPTERRKPLATRGRTIHRASWQRKNGESFCHWTTVKRLVGHQHRHYH